MDSTHRTLRLSLSLLSLSTSVFISRAPYNSGPPSFLPFPSLPLFVSVFLLPFSHSLALFQPSPSSSLSLYRLLLVNIFPFPSPLFYFFFLNIHKPFNLDFPLNLSRSRVYLMLFFFSCYRCFSFEVTVITVLGWCA